MTTELAPAFPSHGTMGEVNFQGMTLLDWYAGKALQGLLAAPGRGGDDARDYASTAAQRAWAIAVAMMDERELRLANIYDEQEREAKEASAGTGHAP